MLFEKDGAEENGIYGVSLFETDTRSRSSEKVCELILNTIRRSSENVKNSEQQEVVDNLTKTIETKGLFDIQKIMYEYQSVYGKNVRQLQGGHESDVYLFESNGNRKIIKITNWNSLNQISNTYKMNSSFLDFLQNKIVAQNSIFPETAYKVIGVDHNFNFILEQPYIEAFRQENGKSKIDEINENMVKRGFVKGLGKFGKFRVFWFSENFIVFDLRPSNVLKGADKELYYVDPIIQSNTDAFIKIIDYDRIISPKNLHIKKK